VSRLKRLWPVLLVALLVLPGSLPAEPASAAARSTAARSTVPDDALVRRVRGELRRFTDWLAAGGARGYIGEVGWPRGAEWSALAATWFRDADTADLWVTAWAAGEWWGSYPLALYGAAGQGEREAVLEAHPSTATRLRGVNVAGAEFAAPSVAATSDFSSVNPGVYDRAYHYDTQASFDRLAARGVRLVRLPFRWERLQPATGKPLNVAELGRLKAAVARAARAGLVVVLDMHNYGGYYRFDGSTGVRHALGAPTLTRFDLADVWGRISRHFRDNPAVAGYGLMNEPAEMPAAGKLTAAKVWERASQAALDRIRRQGDRKLVLVAGYEWSGAQRFATVHPRPWIVDPAANVRYEAHHYWDRDNSGDYPDTYAAEVADAAAHGW
jgi:hypothetical protein